MRNHLAEDVLNCEMLHLMKLYRSSLGDTEHKVDKTIYRNVNTYQCTNKKFQRL